MQASHAGLCTDTPLQKAKRSLPALPAALAGSLPGIPFMQSMFHLWNADKDNLKKLQGPLKHTLLKAAVNRSRARVRKPVTMSELSAELHESQLPCLSFLPSYHSRLHERRRSHLVSALRRVLVKLGSHPVHHGVLHGGLGLIENADAWLCAAPLFCSLLSRHSTLASCVHRRNAGKREIVQGQW